MAGLLGYRSLAPKTKNLVVAGGLTAFVFGAYFYTMRAVGGTDELQVAINKFEADKSKNEADANRPSKAQEMNTLSMSLLHPNLLPTLNLKPLTFPSIQTKPSLTFNIPKSTRLRLSASAAETAVVENDSPPPEPEKLGVVVKPTEKPRLVLKFIWMEKNIGIALDQMIPGHGTVPLSPYYFWPRKDAWEELKELLESKPWISQKQMIILLNQATDIINLWQQSGGNLS
ncbi:hypothetical protein VNO77_21698 [Canavalia gladiata]|uniref:Uncharacterized protein n=1 Tax=Canavalia gladiata TaxID=3824 RepID=A0AAN9LRW0_CANGL